MDISNGVDKAGDFAATTFTSKAFGSYSSTLQPWLIGLQSSFPSLLPKTSSAR